MVRLLLAALALCAAWAAQAAPQRIVTLIPSLTESVCALGACARLVGVDRYSNWPAEVAKLPHLGGLDDVQIERVVALKPDLVLASPSSRAVARLRALGLHVVVIEARTHAEVRSSLTELARLLGEPAAAERVWAGIARDLDTAAARVPAAWRGQRAYVEVAPDPYAAGTVSFIGETLARLGLVNIVPAAMGPFPKLSPEFVVRAQPDLIIATQRDWAAMPGRPGWAALTAVRQGRACAFAPAPYDVLVRPGPRMGEGALLLAACIDKLSSAEAR
ncbi:MAG: helical backbone metal receptor [Proteobacteria bacterium]|nr:helical backbone metal receptor [Pseudomonadota bacterium]